MTTGTAHVVTTTRKYKDRVYRTHLLRRSYRDGGNATSRTKPWVIFRICPMHWWRSFAARCRVRPSCRWRRPSRSRAHARMAT